MLGVACATGAAAMSPRTAEAVLCAALALLPPWLALKYALWCACGATVECLALLAN